MKKLSSSRLIYEKIQKSDFPLFFDLYSDPRVMQYTYLDVGSEPETKLIFQEVCEEKEFTYFTVRDKLSHQFIGFIFYDTTLEHKK